VYVSRRSDLSHVYIYVCVVSLLITKLFCELSLKAFSQA